VLRERRSAGDVVEPVVEGADSGEEEDRSHHHRTDDEHDLRVPDRVPAPPEAQEAHERRTETEAEQRHPGTAYEAGTEDDAPHGSARRLEVRRILLDLLGMGRRHAFCSATHLSNSPCVTTCAFARIVAWPRPH